MRFRPCIDIHEGRVKQIVGATLTDDGDAPIENFESSHSPAYYADLYRSDGLWGGHVIQLGPGCRAAAENALRAQPGFLQVGGGVTPDNAAGWLDAGAAKVIVTSCVFRDGDLDRDRLRRMADLVGPDRLVLDLSCRRTTDGYIVAADRWQTLTSLRVDPGTLEQLAGFCAEFLVHGVDVEGRRQGIEDDLVRLLGRHSPVPTTYAGGVRSLDDVARIGDLGNGRIDYTVGSALDIFGGTGVRYRDLVALQGGPPGHAGQAAAVAP